MFRQRPPGSEAWLPRAEICRGITRLIAQGEDEQGILQCQQGPLAKWSNDSGVNRPHKLCHRAMPRPTPERDHGHRAPHEAYGGVLWARYGTCAHKIEPLEDRRMWRVVAGWLLKQLWGQGLGKGAPEQTSAATMRPGKHIDVLWPALALHSAVLAV